MQIDALVRHPLSRAGLRSVVPLSYRSSARAQLHFAEDWDELLERARESVTEVAVVDPSTDGGSSSNEQLERLRRLLGENRIILYITPDTMDPDHLQALGRMGYRLLLTQGVDDDRSSLENALAAAASTALLHRAREQLEDRLPPPALDLFLATVSRWSPETDGDALAKELAMDCQELRGVLAKSVLPPPRECLGWGRLFFALGMAELRRETVSRLAYRVGYGDPSSLCRLCRRLTDRTAEELFATGGAEAAVAALAERLVG